MGRPSILKYTLLAALGLGLAALPLIAGAAARAEVILGPVAAEVVEVVDGDTVRVKARIWLGQDVTTKVRLAGIDAPETDGRANCEAERAGADAATLRLKDLVLGRRVLLLEVGPDKYAGRVIARLRRDDGLDVGETLLAEGLAVPYDAHTDEWCPLPVAALSPGS